VALSVADRALFLERGQVRFSGPARQLEQRPDLLRSVFLGNAAADDAVPAVEAADRDGGAPVPPPAVLAPQVATGDAALEARGLSVAFGGVRAVQDVSLTVAPQEIVGVIGPNGAGKTTLFDLLSGYLAADGGTVWLAGRDVSGRTPSARARLGLGRSFQDARLFPSLSVEETIATACERWVRVPDPLSAAFHLPNAQDSERAVARRVSELVELLGLGDFRLAFVRELSTGTAGSSTSPASWPTSPTWCCWTSPLPASPSGEVEALAPLIRRVRDETVPAWSSSSTTSRSSDRSRTVSSAMDQGPGRRHRPTPRRCSRPCGGASYLGPDHAAVNRSATSPALPTGR
jgi:branched-chain amino acid transport system ATP-binding protein